MQRTPAGLLYTPSLNSATQQQVAALRLQSCVINGPLRILPRFRIILTKPFVVFGIVSRQITFHYCRLNQNVFFCSTFQPTFQVLLMSHFSGCILEIGDSLFDQGTGCANFFHIATGELLIQCFKQPRPLHSTSFPTWRSCSYSQVTPDEKVSLIRLQRHISIPFDTVQIFQQKQP